MNTASTPPKMDTTILRINKLILTLPDCMIELGLKPNLPNDLIKNILPKTPAMVFPINPEEYFL